MNDDFFREQIDEILKKDPRFPWEAYSFVKSAVSYTSVKLGRNKNLRNERHVKGVEILSCAAEYAISQFGPMAADVMESWGLRDGMSIGAVVFNMIDAKLLNASPEDSLEDFNVGFDLIKILREPFESAARKTTNPPIIA